MLDYCFHTHTFRCGHATGSDEDFVQSALRNGVRRLGFTDHIFYPGYSQPGLRGEYSQLGDYVSSIRGLKAKYADEIEIHLGFEAEYYPEYDSYYKRLLEDHIVEYLILGQHFELQDKTILKYFGGITDPKSVLRYGECLVAGMKTGYYRYVAHPDLFMAAYPNGYDDAVKSVTEAICQASLELNIPLEINLGPMRWRGPSVIGGETRFLYPYEPFWETVGRYGCPVIIGADVHHPEDFDGAEFHNALAMIEKYHLRHIEHLVI